MSCDLKCAFQKNGKFLHAIVPMISLLATKAFDITSVLQPVKQPVDPREIVLHAIHVNERDQAPIWHREDQPAAGLQNTKNLFDQGLLIGHMFEDLQQEHDIKKPGSKGESCPTAGNQALETRVVGSSLREERDIHLHTDSLPSARPRHVCGDVTASTTKIEE